VPTAGTRRESGAGVGEFSPPGGGSSVVSSVPLGIPGGSPQLGRAYPATVLRAATLLGLRFLWARPGAGRGRAGHSRQQVAKPWGGLPQALGVSPQVLDFCCTYQAAPAGARSRALPTCWRRGEPQPRARGGDPPGCKDTTPHCHRAGCLGLRGRGRGVARPSAAHNRAARSGASNAPR